MVAIFANIVEVVVFATGTNALLCVDGALQFGEIRVGIDGAQEDGLVLIHARICEEQRGIRERHNAATGDKCVLMFLEIAKKWWSIGIFLLTST
jgi:hypothetical protein